MLKQTDFQTDRGLSKISLGPISVRGISIAGVQTHLSVPELKLCFDVGYSHPSICFHRNYFITHAHMDHAAGIPYIISNKALNKQSDSNFYVPDKEVKSGLDLILQIWAKLEGHDYKWNIQVLSVGEEIEINSEWKVRAFQTHHRVNSHGYSLLRTKKTLKETYRSLGGAELVRLKNEGHAIEDDLEECFLSVTGDTTTDFLNSHPEIYDCKYLFVECTYASDAKSIAECREWGHIHLDELIPCLRSFRGERIVLKHFSRRYKLNQVLQILDEKLSSEKELREKILVLPF